MKAVGAYITCRISDIRVEVTMTVTEGDLVADRVEAAGTRTDNGQPINWVENHIYRRGPQAAQLSGGGAWPPTHP